MQTINRSAVAVLPAQPFLDWLHQADPTSAHLSLNDLRLEPTLYLLPEYHTEEEAHQHLQRRCREIFEEQLDGWYRAPTAWPADRSFNYVILALGLDTARRDKAAETSPRDPCRERSGPVCGPIKVPTTVGSRGVLLD